MSGIGDLGQREPARRELASSGALFLGGVGLLGCLSPEAPGPTLGVAAFWAWVLLWSGRSAVWVLAGAVLFVVSGVRSMSAVEHFTRQREQVRRELVGVERCLGRVTVVSSPTLESGSGKGAEARLVWLGQTNRLECGARELRGPLALRLGSPVSSLARGDELTLVMQLGVLQLFQNQGLADPRPGAARRRAVLSGNVVAELDRKQSSGLLATIDRLRAHVRERIFLSYRREVVPLARALVLGESDLNEEESLAFSKSGLMHILAVSGTHLVLAVVSLERGLYALLVRCRYLVVRYDVARFTGLLGTGLAFLYADFAGGSGSAFRAAFMLAVVLGGSFLGHSVSGGVALGASLLVGLGSDPLVGYDISFLLSALATLGLLALAQPLAAFIEGHFRGPAWLRFVLDAMALTLCSSVACAPLLARLGGQMTLAALAANLVAGPAGELLALPACLAHALASACPPLERGLGIVGGGALYVVRATALWSASLDALAFRLPVPGAGEFMVMAALGLGLRASLYRRSRSGGAAPATSHESLVARRWVGLGRGAVALGALWLGSAGLAEAKRTPGSAGQLRITALDVGQGDALFLEFPNGQVGLLDGGGYPQNLPDVAERVLLPFLRARGIEALDLLILSHPDRDHMLGLGKVSEQLRVREFWYPGRPNEDSAELKRLLRVLGAQGTRLVPARELCGERRDLGAIAEVLAPCGEALELGRNDASLVLKLSFGQATALFTGDIEGPGEEWLVQARAAGLRADFLKVAHHGSRTSSSEALLGQVRPQVAFISVGARNTFGHPAREVLGRFQAGATSVFRTDELGSLTWTSDGQNAFVESFVAPDPEPVALGEAA
jgi:competence protein ComEC